MTRSEFLAESGSFFYEIKTINDLFIDWEGYFNKLAKDIMVWLDFEVITVKSGYLVSWEPHRTTERRPVPPKGFLIRIVETGEVLRGTRAVAERIGGDYSAVAECLREHYPRYTHKGYSFEYVEEDE